MSVALFFALIALAFFLAHPPTAWSQLQDGATMTVLRGEVAVLRPDGTAIQPAPSGTVIFGGDEIRTLNGTGALITFQVGTQIELGDDTILAIERVSRQGERIDVSVKQVQGISLHQVASFRNPGSAYRVEAGGVVTEIHGTEFVLYGPLPNGVVIIVCSQDCDSRSTFLGKPLGPAVGYYAVVENGKVISGPTMFKPDLSGGLWNAAFEAATMVEQALQGDTDGVPAGQVPQGQRGEPSSRTNDVTDQRQKGPAQSDSDGDPLLTIDDVSVLEGDGSPTFAVFTVRRTGNTDTAASVQFATADGTATAGSDYISTAGTLIFPPGSPSETISVEILDDMFGESTETFVVNLTSPIHVGIADAQGMGTIFDDDLGASLPGLTIDDQEVSETFDIPNVVVFTVTRTAPTALASTVDYTTVDGSAVAGSDYSPTSGSLVFAPGSTSEVIMVSILNDEFGESPEAFTVKLSSPVGATILDDEGECLIYDDDGSP